MPPIAAGRLCNSQTWISPLVERPPLFTAIPRCRPTRRRPRRPPLRSPARAPAAYLHHPHIPFQSAAKLRRGMSSARSVVPECSTASASAPANPRPPLRPPSPPPPSLPWRHGETCGRASGPPPAALHCPLAPWRSGQRATGVLGEENERMECGGGRRAHQPARTRSDLHTQPPLPSIPLPTAGLTATGRIGRTRGQSLAPLSSEPVVSAFDASALDHAGTPTATTNHTRQWPDRGEPPPNPNPAPHSACPPPSTLLWSALAPPLTR